MTSEEKSSPTLARAFTALSGASIVSMGAQLVRGKLGALILGPAGVGVFNQLSLLWNLFQIGGSLGSFNGLVQHGSEALADRDTAALRRLSSTWSILLATLSCLMAAGGALFAEPISDALLNDAGKHAALVALILLSVPLGVTAQLYRALLSASRAVRQLVQAQIQSDVGAAIIFVALIIPFGLQGAVLGFMSAHLIFFIVTVRSVRKLLGPDVTIPRFKDFSWSVVRSNAGFGASGIIMIALSNLSILLVSRMIIEWQGLDASGIFSNAWRIATVYLGAVTTTAITYYLPTLIQAKTHERMSRELNATVRFYLYLLPLIMTAIMAGGEPIAWLILSREFLPVAPLLLIFVPAELMRILAETFSMPLLARRRVLPFTLLYVAQATIFVAGALAAVPLFGLVGAAAAYALATAVAAVATFAVARNIFGIRLEMATFKALMLGVGLLLLVAAASFLLPFGLVRLLACAVLSLIWAVLALRDDDARNGMSAVLARLGFRRLGGR